MPSVVLLSQTTPILLPPVLVDSSWSTSPARALLHVGSVILFRCRDCIEDFNRPRALPTRFSGTGLSCCLVAAMWIDGADVGTP